MASKNRVGRHAQGQTASRSPQQSDKRRLTAALAIILAALLAVTVILEFSRNRQSVLGPINAVSAAPAGAPWEYDAANNRHWDPGHGHWHDGPPPAGAAPQTAATQPAPTLPGPTPEPWEHDAANNRHWDPGHGHWHPGPPPPPQAR